MKSVKGIYKIGFGPSSSHTIAPTRAAKWFLDKYGDALSFSVTLYGSLAYTCKGHSTDNAIKKVFDGRKIEVVSDTVTKTEHPNTMRFSAYYPSGVKTVEILSVGGGDLRIEGEEDALKEVYREKNFDEIKKYCEGKSISLVDYVVEREGDLSQYLSTVWEAMKASIKEGLNATGVLPGGLMVNRRAKDLFNGVALGNKENTLVAAYAFAAAEQNAAGETVVTAPTCGACGVLPAVLYRFQKMTDCDDEKIFEGLICAGVIGNVIKQNASISGAECGCQAEIGSACAMAAAALAYLNGLDINEIEYCAEMALEHHLGLTCDPVGGLVQIPCIERNALAAMQAFNFVGIAPMLAKSRKVDFDTIVLTMYETGRDLNKGYRETSTGGLAKHYKRS